MNEDTHTKGLKAYGARVVYWARSCRKGASLVAQRSRIHPPVQETWEDTWSRKIPHTTEQLSWTPQPSGLSFRAQEPQPLSLHAPEPMLHSRRSHHKVGEAWTRWRGGPTRHTRGKKSNPHTGMKIQPSQDNKWIKIFKKINNILQSI